MSATTPADRDRSRSCEGKKKVYFERAHAERAALNATERLHEIFQAYPCRHCSGYHIGHAPRQIGRTVLRSCGHEQRVTWTVGDGQQLEHYEATPCGGCRQPVITFAAGWNTRGRR